MYLAGEAHSLCLSLSLCLCLSACLSLSLSLSPCPSLSCRVTEKQIGPPSPPPPPPLCQWAKEKKKEEEEKKNKPVFRDFADAENKGGDFFRISTNRFWILATKYRVFLGCVVWQNLTVATFLRLCLFVYRLVPQSVYLRKP